MRKLKQILGIFLMIAAIAGLFYWENIGRAELMTEKVLVATRDIPQKTIVTREMFTSSGVMKENRLKSGLSEADFYKIEGKEATQLILKNQQVSAFFFKEPGIVIKQGMAPYVIKGDWIGNRSGTLRKGDHIGIYSWDGSIFIGDFEVAFVKDAAEQEITDTVNSDVLMMNGEKEIPERVNNSGIVDHIEVFATLEEYQKIVTFALAEGQQILIVQKGAWHE